MPIVQSDRELLHASRERAKRVLAHSSEEARALIEKANSEAISLLLEQQQIAAALLLNEHEQAVRTEERAGEEIESLPEGDRERAGAELKDEAADLRARQEAAASALLEAQKEAAARLKAAVDEASVDILMRGQREAAAILLEARMLIEAGRSR